MTYQEPPPGWSAFGHHANDNPVPSIVFSKEVDEAGMPLWERPVNITDDTWFYDRDGQPLSIADADRLLGDRDYRRVALDQIGPYRVSTVWRGVDYAWGEGGPPVIFETMVFGPADDLNDIDVVRYSTEAEATAGHEEVCTLVRAVYQPIDTREEDPHESQNR